MASPVVLPPPRDLGEPVRLLLEELVGHLGRTRVVQVAVALLEGAPRTAYAGELEYLTGFSSADGAPVLDRAAWPDHWPRTWGARALLHVWSDEATPAVLTGLADPHWRPVEMCLKVTTRHEVAGTGDAAAALAEHERPRVRTQVARALGVVGDSEHLAALEVLADDVSPDVRRPAAQALSDLRRRLDLPG